MWHYGRAGRTVGPMEWTELVERAQRGEFGPDDLVWQPEFGPEWRRAGSIEGLFPALPNRCATGTGGLTPNHELTRRARRALAGHWAPAVGGTLLVIVLGMAIQALAALTDMAVPPVGTAAALALLPPLTVGLMRFFLLRNRGAAAEVAEVFRGFRSWWPAVVAALLVQLFMMLWALAVFLPVGLAAIAVAGGLRAPARPEGPIARVLALGAVAAVVALIAVALRYTMTFFAIADDPACGPIEAIRRSVRLMRGHKWKYLWFTARFIGWAILASLPCGLGWLWLFPYFWTASAAFYEDLKRPDD